MPHDENPRTYVYVQDPGSGPFHELPLHSIGRRPSTWSKSPEELRAAVEETPQLVLTDLEQYASRLGTPTSDDQLIEALDLVLAWCSIALLHHGISYRDMRGGHPLGAAALDAVKMRDRIRERDRD